MHADHDITVSFTVWQPPNGGLPVLSAKVAGVDGRVGAVATEYIDQQEWINALSRAFEHVIRREAENWYTKLMETECQR